MVEPVEGRVEVLHERFVLEFDGYDDLFGGVVCLCFDAFVSLCPGLVFVELLEYGVRGLLVVPEIGRSSDFLEVAYLLFAFIDVKDTPVTVPGGG
jgi:hypothetical protein